MLGYSHDLEGKSWGIQSCASNVVKNRATLGLGSTQNTLRIMKENGIMVDYEWAYKEVVLSHDFKDKSSAWVNAFVEVLYHALNCLLVLWRWLQ